jgi:hypothetical protein
MTPPEKQIPEQAPSGSGVSRRGFLKGAGFTAAGTVIATTGLSGLAEAEPADPAALGPGRQLST